MNLSSDYYFKQIKEILVIYMKILKHPQNSQSEDHILAKNLMQ